MAYLLDTHALIWWWEDDPRPSAISGLEIAIKVRLGKLPNMVGPISEYPDNIERDGLAHLAILPVHARVGGLLPGAHRDPFDRVLAAQALTEGLTMVTRDPAFATFGCATLW